MSGGKRVGVDIGGMCDWDQRKIEGFGLDKV